MKKPKFSAKIQRFPEILLTTLLGDIPAIALGAKLRNLLYRSIFARLDSQVYIQNGVEFLGSNSIEICKQVFIFKGVRLDGRGENNQIYLGNKVAIERNVDIGCLDGTSIYIDDETFIGPNVCIAGPGNIKIGKHCMIASHCGIYANNHTFTNPLEPIRNQGITRQGIVIEDDCWLGHGVSVLDGVTIGQGSVIGAGAVVTKDIPPFSVAVGIPAKVIKSRVSEEIGMRG
ncbi:MULTISPECIES: acyltransferase [Calothrix]|uniref:Acyltransferase n=2 Tax=Calothrix TaxID=1186 RepID=A0ABR8AGM5_9CYAN|nr:MULTISPECIES: acyltransferase [Calothrix]MBD2199197.1 acyltransferase [Calothrix parietina FACHB-288]MBD2227899.1 acyltransferase [Calothrix anomala FACHB-343]